MKLDIVRGSSLCSNCFILSEENQKKLLVVDIGIGGKLTGFALKKSLASIVNKKFSDYSVEVFLTHCHIDHILGENNLRDFEKVTFSASEKAAKHINSRDNVTLVSKYGGKINYSIDKIYSDGEILKFGDTELEVIYTPGHTDGSAILYDKEGKNLFAGDVVFAGGACGRVDFPTGNRQAMISTLGKVAKLDIDHLYSGHGPDMHKNIKANILSAKQMMEYW